MPCLHSLSIALVCSRTCTKLPITKFITYGPCTNDFFSPGVLKWRRVPLAVRRAIYLYIWLLKCGTWSRVAREKKTGRKLKSFSHPNETFFGLRNRWICYFPRTNLRNFAPFCIWAPLKHKNFQKRRGVFPSYPRPGPHQCRIISKAFSQLSLQPISLRKPALLSREICLLSGYRWYISH